MSEVAVGSGSCESSVECLGLGWVIFRVLVIDGEDSPDISFLGYHESVWRNGGMRGDVERGGAVTHGRIWML